jgi:hypothetical protein
MGKEIDVTNGSSRFGTSKDVLGFLVAAFAGALNIFGLKSAEVGDVLRNNSASVSLVAGLLLAGLICAIVSVFASEDNAIRLGIALGVAVLATLCFPLVIWQISPPGASLGPSAMIAGGILILVAVLCMIIFPKKEPKNLSNLQCALLVVAVIVTSAAAYGGLRLETISQGKSFTQIDDKIQITSKNDILAVTVAASKLSTQQWVSVRILGVHRKGFNIKTACRKLPANVLSTGNAAGVSCDSDPCYYFSNGPDRCTTISTEIFPPDSSGTVRQTFTIAFLPTVYQHLQLYAVVCNPTNVGGAPTGACKLSSNPTSRLDQSVPLGSG